MRITTIKRIRKLDIDSKRYDIETEDVHNFFANNILVHNSNFQFSISQDEIRCGTRTRPLIDGDNFFCWEEMYDKYADKILKESPIIVLSGSVYGSVKQITLFGELYGGYYNHPEVKISPNAVKIQKGISYSNANDVMLFDIYLTLENGKGRWLSHTLVEKFANIINMPYAKTLYQGTFDECLKYPNDFQSTIYKFHDLPKVLGDNVCEGVVIKPLMPRHFPNGERVILKNKNDKWSEKARTPKVKRKPVGMNPTLSKHYEEMSLLVTENRLKNLLSKTGPIDQKDFGKLMSAMFKDVEDEYTKDNKEYSVLGKADKKQISKSLTKNIASIIRPNFVNIIDGTYP